ncbi:MAG: EamA family transporter [Sphingomonas sp.]|nr:MAG: EamA family transporter [Sphingomonas sp.]
MNARTLFQFAAVTLIWGTTWIVIKYQLGTVSPSWSISYRFLTGGLSLLAWCAFARMPLIPPRHAFPFLALVGLFQFVLNFNFVYRSELYIPSGIPAVAFALLMVPNALLAWLFLKRPVSRRFMLGSALGIAGVGLLFAQQLSLPGNRAETALGLSLVAAAVLSASIANVMQASPKALSFPPITGLAWSMLIGTAVNALFALLVAGPPQFDPAPVYWLGFLYLGVFASAVAFAIYFDLIRRMGPAEAAWTSVLIPILAMAISTVLEGYRWTAMAAVGVAVTLTGMVVALRQPTTKPTVETRSSQA